MNFFKKLFDFYIDNNIHVGLAAASFVVVTQLNSNSDLNINFVFFVFFSSIFAYIFIRIFDNCKLSYASFSSRLRTTNNATLFVSVLALFGLTYFGFQINLNRLLLLIPFVFITFWYAVPLPDSSNRFTSLRNHPRLKLVSIALVWAVVTAIFPLQELHYNSNNFILFIQRIIIIIILVLPFDIRDMNKDSSHLQTLPQSIGIEKTKRIGLYLAFLFIILTFLRINTLSNKVLSDLFIVLLSVFFLYHAKTKQSQYYASFWVEAAPIFWLFVVLVFD